jgi:hypothetical protein
MSGRLYLLMMVWAVLQALWPASVMLIELWRLFVLRLLLFCLFFVASVVYVGDASVLKNI